MPGFDGTGPRGEGPMTGGGRGNCNPNYKGTRSGGFYGAGRGGMPWGGGRGRAWGGGRGYGWNAFARQPGAWDERAYLTDQLAALEGEIQEIKRRLGELDEGKDKS